MSSSSSQQLQPHIEEVKDFDDFVTKYQFAKNKYDTAQEHYFKTREVDNATYVDVIQRTQQLIRYMDKLDQFKIQRYKDYVKDLYYMSAELLVRTVGLNNPRKGFNEREKTTLITAVMHARKVLDVEPFHRPARDLFKLVYLYFTIHEPDPKENVKMLQQVLLVDPADYQLNFNLGFQYHRSNDLDNSLKHYKLAVGLLDLHIGATDKDKHPGAYETLMKFKIKCLNGLGAIYYNIQNRDVALYYFKLAYELSPTDPDINNQIAVVNTELRFTEEAIKHYDIAIANHDKAHISQDKTMLLASVHMNKGLALCYECEFEKAIESYNRALRYKPRLSLAYQNKLLDVNYIAHKIEDPMYISNLHKNLNKIYPKVITNYHDSLPNYKVKKSIIKARDIKDLKKRGIKMNIGFVSGDFICHPVAYFLHSVLNHIDYDMFNVYCYTVKIQNLDGMFKKCNWRIVKNVSPEKMKKQIEEDNIDILFDMSAHTGDNRLDTFVLKPAPIQMTWCGYPNSAGIKSMDYRLVDNIVDGPESQKYYVEKFVYMPKCFLAYSPSMGIENIPKLVETQPAKTNGYITFGSFNRFNKINDELIHVWGKVLQRAPNARFMIKTKEFLTPKLRKRFFDNLPEDTHDRVIVVSYKDTYSEHLVDYNDMDISLDTFPYAGTTTSCESLMMGVPIITLFDNVRHYHAQNVTTTLLKNSDMDEYVCYSEEEYINKAVYYANNVHKLENLKRETREKFVTGNVCDYKQFNKDFAQMLLTTYQEHHW